MRRTKSRKKSKYNYRLFKLVDEGTMEEVCERNAMSKGGLEYGIRNNRLIYADYYVVKIPKGEEYENKNV